MSAATPTRKALSFPSQASSGMGTSSLTVTFAPDVFRFQTEKESKSCPYHIGRLRVTYPANPSLFRPDYSGKDQVVLLGIMHNLNRSCNRLVTQRSSFIRTTARGVLCELRVFARDHSPTGLRVVRKARIMDFEGLRSGLVIEPWTWHTMSVLARIQRTLD